MARRSIRDGMIGLGLAALLACAASAEPAPEFRPAPCALPDIPAEAASRLRCGTVAVPKRYDQPELGNLNLSVAILSRPDDPPLRDPVLYIQGGPGFPLLDHADYLLHQILAPRRDLILVDQRGTGRSEPMFCRGGTKAMMDVLARGGPALTLSQGFRAAYAACRDEILAAHAEAFFGTDVTAEDMDRVRKALDLDDWNVYGVSYGTTVAMTLAARYPRRIRAMVLDSAYPPEPLPVTRKQSFEASLQRLFQLCAADAPCNSAYPALDRLYADTLRRLDEAPLAVPLPASLGLPGNQLMLGAPEFEILSFLTLYERGGWSVLPLVIRAVHDGSGAVPAPLFAGILRWFGEQNLGAILAVQCRDRPYRAAGEVPPSLIDLLSAGGDICRGWPVAGPEPELPEGARMPVLVLEGGLDPITPPLFGRAAARAIGRSAVALELPGVAHGVQSSSLCGAILVWRFFRSPYQPPDRSCISSLPPLSFAAVAQAVPAPAP